MRVGGRRRAAVGTLWSAGRLAAQAFDTVEFVPQIRPGVDAVEFGRLCQLHEPAPADVVPERAAPDVAVEHVAAAEAVGGKKVPVVPPAP